MSPNGPYFELIYHDDTIYKGWIHSKLILMHKSVLVTTQGCTRDSEQVLQTDLIN